MSTSLVSLVSQSERADLADRYDFDWPATLPDDGLWMSDDLLSIAGTEIEAALSERAIARLSRFECLNFFSLNVHGIRDLLRAVLVWSHHPAMAEYSAFLEHFLIEETQHLRFFAEFCRRYGQGHKPSRTVAFPERAPEDERRFLAFAGVLIFEETGHIYNQRMMRDERLPEIVRALNRTHYEDEGRHIAAGRKIVADLYHGLAQSRDAPELARLRDRVADLQNHNTALYYTPRTYADAGFDAPADLARALLSNPARQRRHMDLVRKTTSFFDALFGVPEDRRVG